MKTAHITICCLLVVAPLVAHAFLVTPSTIITTITTNTPHIRSTSGSSTLLLWAKKARNKKPKNSSASASSSSGGFGAATATTGSSNTKDDYAVFPALEPDVKTTLVAASAEQDSALRNEIYQRLDQIYGFSNFNYETAAENDDNNDGDGNSGGMMSMEDLISGNLSEEDDDDIATDDFSISQLPAFDDNDIRVLHVDPLVLSVDNFFTPEESDAYVAMPLTDKSMFQTGSMTVGKDKQSQSQRTSTTWFNHYKNVPALMAKASRLLGLEGIDRWEEPQTVRYRRNEKFTWHLDALGPEELTSTGGGQRVATLLVYHTDLDIDAGGATMFRDLKDENGERLKV